MTKENTSQDPKGSKTSCPECSVNVGVGLALKVAEMAEVPVEDVKEQLFNQEITVQTALDTIKGRLKDDFHIGLIEEAEQAMREELEKKLCISVFVKQKMSTELDGWIQDREKALEYAEPESDFAKGTKELIENLKKSKESIENQLTCEAESET